jgi:type VI protein secretion system component VasF
MADAMARERIRRRLATVSPRPRSAQEILLERAFDEVDRLQHRLREDEYVPWTAIAATAAVVVGAVGLAVWMRRRGIGQQLVPA